MAASVRSGMWALGAAVLVLALFAVARMNQDDVTVAGVAGALAALPLAVALAVLAATDRAATWLFTGALVAYLAVTVSLATTASVRGQSAATWIFGVAAAVPALLLLFTLLVTRLSDPRDSSAAGSLAAQLAGLVVPVGSLAAARLTRPGAPRLDSPAAVVSAVGALAMLAAVAFLILRLCLDWLRPDPLPVDRDVKRTAVEPPDRTRTKRDPLQAPYRRLSAPERSQSVLVDDSVESGSMLSHYLRWEPAIGRPLISPAVGAALRDTLLRTGMFIDEVWPRIEMVLPAEVRKAFRRHDRAVVALRIAVAGAMTTSLAWAGITAGLFGAPASPARIVSATTGPLLVAVVLLAGLRIRVADLYQQRAEAVELYRFDLARAMHLPVPRDPAAFRAAGTVLMGWDESDRLVATAGETEQRMSTMQVDDLRRAVVDEVTRALEPELRQIRDAVATRPGAAPGGAAPGGAVLGEAEVAALAARMAEQALGPPLVNFTGFLVVDAAGHDFRAPAGSTLDVSLHVLRGDIADDSFATVERIEISDGHAGDRVEFDAVADSPTLRPAPNRHTLSVTEQGTAHFSFPLPEQPGVHEIWFQLYQAGRLIQAITVHAQGLPRAAPVSG